MTCPGAAMARRGGAGAAVALVGVLTATVAAELALGAAPSTFLATLAKHRCDKLGRDCPSCPRSLCEDIGPQAELGEPRVTAGGGKGSAAWHSYCATIRSGNRGAVHFTMCPSGIVESVNLGGSCEEPDPSRSSNRCDLMTLSDTGDHPVAPRPSPRADDHGSIEGSSRSATESSRNQTSQIEAPNSEAPIFADDLLNRLWSPSQLQAHPQEALSRPTFPEAIGEERMEGPNDRDVRPPDFAPGMSVRRADVPNAVALTFDLCEGPNEVAGYEGRIVEFLRLMNIPATFFIGGRWMRDHPERTMQLMATSTFEIGNHGWEHRNMRGLSRDEVRAEVGRTQDEYRKVRRVLQQRAIDAGIGREGVARVQSEPRLLRFPYGTCDRLGLDTVADMGLSAIQWDVVSGDPDRSRTASAMVKGVIEATRGGSILIFHANGRGWATPEALPQIVDGLRARGFEFLTVSDLLRRPRIESGVQAAETCYELRPGDNLRYDRIGNSPQSKKPSSSRRKH